MSALLVLLLVLTLSLLVTRLATAALMLTGVSHKLARLQALSALTGVGFTTKESERIVDHPVRRRILILMMLAGNAGFVTEGATLMLSFAGVATRAEGLWRGGWLLGGLAALWLVARDERLEHLTVRLMGWALRRWTDLEGYDYVELLELSEGYRVRTFSVNPGAWVEGRRLGELSLFDEGITVLGIHRPDGTYLGVPRGETPIGAGDQLVLYGRDGPLRALEGRPGGSSGGAAHRRAVADHERLRLVQAAADEALGSREASGRTAPPAGASEA